MNSPEGIPKQPIFSQRIIGGKLTEPLVGSATSGGMLTTCRREGETWILNGQKKWIGNSTFSDINVIWARAAWG